MATTRLYSNGALLLSGEFDEVTQDTISLTSNTYFSNEFDEVTGTPVVDSSLVLWLDALQTSSYPGSGTTWSDLSGNGNNGTLTNGPTFNSSNGGSILFDGSNDRISLGTSFTQLDLIDKTIQCWIKKSSASFKGIVDKDFDSGGGNYGGWGFWIQSNNKLQWWAASNLDLLDNGVLTVSNTVWTNVAVTWDSIAKTAKFYINGTLNSTKTNVSIIEKASGSANFLVGAVRNNVFHFNGNISAVKAYSRILSDQEIERNFNALRRRYGI